MVVIPIPTYIDLRTHRSLWLTKVGKSLVSYLVVVISRTPKSARTFMDKVALVLSLRVDTILTL